MVILAKKSFFWFKSSRSLVQCSHGYFSSLHKLSILYFSTLCQHFDFFYSENKMITCSLCNQMWLFITNNRIICKEHRHKNEFVLKNYFHLSHWTCIRHIWVVLGFFAIIVDSIFFVGLSHLIGWASLQSSLGEKIGLLYIWFILKLKTWSGIHSYGMKWKRSLPFVWIPTFHSPSRIIQVWVSLWLWDNLFFDNQKWVTHFCFLSMNQDFYKNIFTKLLYLF